jgi:hypothetical protein
MTILAFPVDRVLGPAAFLHDLRAIYVEICCSARLLSCPSMSALNAITLNRVHDAGAFSLEGYCLPLICDACGYVNDLAGTFEVLSSRLSWLCRAWLGGSSGFLKMLYDSGALIAGSAALKVVSGKDFVPSDIDIVVSPLGEDAVEDFLVTRGYRLVSSWVAGIGEYYTSSLPGLRIRRYACGQRSIDVSISPVSFQVLTAAVYAKKVFVVFGNSV